MKTRKIHRIKVLNRYYKMTGFYHFMRNIFVRTGLIIGILIGLYFALDYFVFDTEAIFHKFASKYSPAIVFTLFFTSEVFLGLIPPEFFIAWTSKTINPWFYVFLLSTVSYTVGLLAYFLGQKLFLVASVKRYIEINASRHINNLKKWGGVFIFIGAMLPIPYSMVSLTSGLINYKIKYYMLWSLFRYVRFFLYAMVVFRFI